VPYTPPWTKSEVDVEASTRLATDQSMEMFRQPTIGRPANQSPPPQFQRGAGLAPTSARPAAWYSGRGPISAGQEDPGVAD
jgi:hypothetical protein